MTLLTEITNRSFNFHKLGLDMKPWILGASYVQTDIL